MSDILDLPDLLDLLGYTAADHVQACSAAGGVFTARCATAAVLPMPSGTADEWFGVNPVAPFTEKRPKSSDVTRLAAVWADLDVKAGGCADFDTARAIVDDLSTLIGTRPVALTYSGHGIQPYWAIEDAPITDDGAAEPTKIERPLVRATLRQWGRLVAHVAELRGAKVDSVFDLTRILRMPGSVNLKDPAAPVPVVTLPDIGAPVTFDRLAETLAENGIVPVDEDYEDPGVVVSPPAEWDWGVRTCTYARNMIDGWERDAPEARHPWLLSQATRLACLRRAGCVTEEDHSAAIATLVARFRALLATGQVRKAHPGEITDALSWGTTRAATLSEAALGHELGGHLTSERATAASTPDDPFGTGIPAPQQPGPVAAQIPQAAPRLAVVPDAAPGPQTAGALAIAEQPVQRLRRLTTLTDYGNAELMVARHVGRLRYVPSRGAWLKWTGTHWHWCEDDGEAIQAAVETVRAIEAPDTETRKHRERSLSRRALEAVVLLARRDERMRVEAQRLDADPYMLNTPSGIVDLRTGELAPHDPESLCTKVTRVGYDPQASTPGFDAFLSVTFGGDQAIIGFLQRLVGYSATGLSLHHVLPFMHGGGGNGKGVFTAVSTGALGMYATTTPPDFLLVGGRDDESAIARLAGMRMVVASEVSQQAKFNEAKMKHLTGGDELTARFLYQNYFTFTPSHTLWLMANHLPRVEAGGDSFWRRLRLIPFNYTVPGDQRDEMLAERLLIQEGPGILAWMVHGAVSALTEGLKDPDGVRVATAEYAEEEDALARFLDEACVLEAGSYRRTNTKVIREAYNRWCRDEDEKPISSQAFGRELRNRFGIQSTRANGQRFYVDLSLRADVDDDSSYQSSSIPNGSESLWG